jgi:hypothetical protein
MRSTKAKINGAAFLPATTCIGGQFCHYHRQDQGFCSAVLKATSMHTCTCTCDLNLPIVIWFQSYRVSAWGWLTHAPCQSNTCNVPCSTCSRFKGRPLRETSRRIGSSLYSSTCMGTMLSRSSQEDPNQRSHAVQVYTKLKNWLSYPRRLSLCMRVSVHPWNGILTRC